MSENKITNSYLSQGIKPKGLDKILLLLVCLNLLVCFIRPQDLPGLGFIGTIKFPATLSIIIGVLSLPLFMRSWKTPVKLLAIFLIVEMFRGVFGYYFESLVKNDFWQFHTFKALCLTFLGLTFPICFAASSLGAMDKLVKTFTIIGVFLGLYSVTHAGQGPGSFLADENDLCFSLLAILPFVILNFFKSKSVWRLISLAGVLLMLGGIAFTLSRGGMLGLGAMLAFVILGTKYRVKGIVFCFVLGLAVLPFIPKEFWLELVSIKTDVSADTGTVKKRKEMWQVAWKIFSEPKNIPIGVGMNNTPFWIADFEEEALGRRNKTYSGRAIHSMYFQILPELGLYGLFLLGAMFWKCSRGVYKAHKKLIRFLQALSTLKPNGDEDRRALLSLADRGNYASLFCLALSFSWIGTLVSGVGVSVLYYPTLWILVGLSVAALTYSENVISQMKTYSDNRLI